MDADEAVSDIVHQIHWQYSCEMSQRVFII